jgi:hypothetical protein
MKREEAESILRLAKIEFTDCWELMNQYWPRHEDYYKTIIKNPWWLFQTKFGLIKIGWRKRVIVIDWSGTEFRFEGDRITTDVGITKTETMIHAWGEAKAVEYLTMFRAIAESAALTAKS